MVKSPKVSPKERKGVIVDSVALSDNQQSNLDALSKKHQGISEYRQYDNGSVGVFFNDCLKILQLCAFNDATDEEFMKSFQEKFDCTEEHCKIAKLYWASEREKIHTTLCNDATWSTTLKNFSWRLDVTTTRNDTSSEPEFSAPVALVEMNTGKKNSNSVSSIKFQMSKTELNDLVLEVNKIQNLIQTYVENPEEDKEEA